MQGSAAAKRFKNINVEFRLLICCRFVAQHVVRNVQRCATSLQQVEASGVCDLPDTSRDAGRTAGDADSRAGCARSRFPRSRQHNCTCSRAERHCDTSHRADTDGETHSSPRLLVHRHTILSSHCNQQDIRKGIHRATELN